MAIQTEIRAGLTTWVCVIDVALPPDPIDHSHTLAGCNGIHCPSTIINATCTGVATLTISPCPRRFLSMPLLFPTLAALACARRVMAVRQMLRISSA
jgi:hypothetical protein